MRRTAWLGLAAMVAAGGMHAAVGGIEWKDVPERVRAALQEADVAPEEVVRVSADEVRGQRVYDFDVQRDEELNARVRITAEGAVLRDTRRPPAPGSDWPARAPHYDGAAPPGAEAVAGWPEPVQQAVTRLAAGREIAEAETRDWGGQAVFVAKLAGDEGETLFLDHEGNELRGERAARVTRRWMSGTTFADLPRPVQQTIERELEPQQINDIDLQRRPGGNLYEVHVRGQNVAYKLRIDTEGRIVEDTRRGADEAAEASE